jgi:hypothetical protein
LAKWIATAVLMALIAGCGGSNDGESQAAAPSPSPAAEEPLFMGDEGVEEEYDQPPQPASGDVGDTITLTGSNIGVRLRVTVTGVQRAGRYTAVKLRLVSTGDAIFESELRGAVVRYSDGRRGKLVFGVKAACSNGFQKGLRLDSGQRVRGCVLFRRPTAAAPKSMKLALEAEPVQQGGLWRLG